MVAVLFATFAIAATGVTTLRHKADLERPIAYVIVGISVNLAMFVSQLSCANIFQQRRTIALSLPHVFLAYSILAFVAGITLSSFRGKTVESPLQMHTVWFLATTNRGSSGVPFGSGIPSVSCI